jgi:hypothetical protein
MEETPPILHVSLRDGEWDRIALDPEDWSDLVAANTGVRKARDESSFEKTQKFGRVFLSNALAFITQKNVAEPNRSKASELLRLFELEMCRAKANTEELLSDPNASFTTRANHSEVAYRAAYRSVLLAIDQFCHYCATDYHELLCAITLDYPDLLEDFPKCER